MQKYHLIVWLENHSEAAELSLRALSLLQKLQYSSFELLFIGVKQSWQYFMILGDNLGILRMFKIKHLILTVHCNY